MDLNPLNTEILFPKLLHIPSDVRVFLNFFYIVLGALTVHEFTLGFTHRRIRRVLLYVIRRNYLSCIHILL